MDSRKLFLDLIKSLPKFGPNICLARLDKLLSELELKSYLSDCSKIVVTGTNGKGSTSHYLNRLFLYHGQYNVGLFTSPHFLEYNERFRLGGTPVSFSVLMDVYNKIKSKILKVEKEQNEHFGVFEVLFILSIAVFKELQVNLLIYEAGIGGRYDPTRLLRTSLSILTSIDLEHTLLLGNSSELIGYDKMDACYQGGEIIAGNIPDRLFEKLKVYGSLNNIKLINSQETIELESDETGEIAASVSGNYIKISGVELNPFQQINLKTALTALRSFFNDRFPTSIDFMLTSLLKNFTVDGRVQLISEKPKIYIDAAHTNDAFKILFDYIAMKYKNKSIMFLCGISETRNPEYLLERLTELNSPVIFTKPSFKGQDPLILKQSFKPKSEQVVTIIESPQDALDHINDQTTNSDTTIFVIGSLFLAGESAAILNRKSLDSLYLY